ncbi:MAG: hypothetical protein M4579_000205 [Chaenotheca gracillima]|nr:MAG: hypothetical protein M4579_000205 [Chaenotheca gracillima]
MAADQEKKNIVIIGGGIIGCTTAYYLTRHPSFNPSLHSVTLLEATKIAGGSSGKAGGLLALWAYPSNIVPLSYRLHAELAKEHNGEDAWGYRRIHCGQLAARGRPMASNLKSAKANGDSVSLQKRSEEAMGTFRAAGIPKDLDWFDAESVEGYDEMGDPDTTAQVHPYQFTTTMARLASDKGAKIEIGSVSNIEYDGDSVKSVKYTNKETSESHTIPASHVILSAGPWTRTVYPKAPISAMRAHSVTVRPSRPVSAYAIFTQISIPSNFHDAAGQNGKSSKRTRGSGSVTSPEMYARPNNEVYCCGEGDHVVPLPKSSDLVQIDQRRCDEIIEQVSAISDEMRDGEVTTRQACYLPNVTGAASGPLIGETGVKGLLIAAGHTCWGIQNGPGTGKLMSEFVFDGKAKSANVRSLDPRNVM